MFDNRFPGEDLPRIFDEEAEQIEDHWLEMDAGVLPSKENWSVSSSNSSKR